MSVVVTVILAIVSFALWSVLAIWADVMGLGTDDPVVGSLAVFIGIGIGLSVSMWGNDA